MYFLVHAEIFVGGVLQTREPKSQGLTCIEKHKLLSVNIKDEHD